MLWLIVIGLLLCIAAIWLFVIAATMEGKDEEERIWDECSEDVKKDIIEMMKELGGDEEE